MTSSRQPPTYSHEISSTAQHTADEIIPNFTATGRPFNLSQANSTGLDAINTSESMGAGPANILPVRYHDDSLITIPVLSHKVDISVRYHDASIPPPSYNDATSSSSYDDPNTNPIKHDTSNGLKFWRRKSSTSTSSSTPTPNKYRKAANENFVMKKVTRGEYLKHYAKDDAGRYCGTEDPARDCILRDAGDITKYRRGGIQWRNEIEPQIKTMQQRVQDVPGLSEKEMSRRST